MEAVVKNEKTQYILSGYPKERMHLSSETRPQSEVLLILTKLRSDFQCDLIISIVNSFEIRGFTPIIKFHPLEAPKKIARFKNKLIFKREGECIGEYSCIIVIDSTFAIDLLFSGKPVIPLSFSSLTSFSKYFGFFSIDKYAQFLAAANAFDITTDLCRRKVVANVVPEFRFDSISSVTTQCGT
jgi:hypothetical protein